MSTLDTVGPAVHAFGALGDLLRKTEAELSRACRELDKQAIRQRALSVANAEVSDLADSPVPSLSPTKRLRALKNDIAQARQRLRTVAVSVVDPPRRSASSSTQRLPPPGLSRHGHPVLKPGRAQSVTRLHAGTEAQQPRLRGESFPLHAHDHQFKRVSQLTDEARWFAPSRAGLDLMKLLDSPESPPPAAEPYGQLTVIKPEQAVQPVLPAPKPVPLQARTFSFASGELERLAPPVRPQQRDYDALMDAFSLHRIMIRKGAVVGDTPEFISFRRKYGGRWIRVVAVLSWLEELVKSSQLPLVYADGNKVVALSERLSVERKGGRSVLLPPHPPDLARCLQDVDAGEILRHFAGFRFYGDAGRERAAVKIQATYRGHWQRLRFRTLQHQIGAATTIQRAFRSFRMHAVTRAAMASAWHEKLTRWRGLQRQWARSWTNLQEQQHVVIHIPSLAGNDSEVRNALRNLTARQNAQLPRVCQVANANTDVVFVSSLKLGDDIVEYFQKLLELGGVSNVTSRVKFLHTSPQLGASVSLAQAAWCSPPLLRRIREFIRGRPAWIVPGDAVSVHDVRLAVELQLPLLGPEEQTSQTFGRHSSVRNVFHAASVPCAPFAVDNFFPEALFGSLARLLVEYPQYTRWLIKIDDERDGRGVAFYEPASMREHAAMMRDRAALDWSAPHSSAVRLFREKHTQRLALGLSTHVPQHAVLCCPALFDCQWAKFAHALFRSGGVVEPAPLRPVATPRADFLIAPNGSVRLLAVHDLVTPSPYVVGGALFPSTVHHATVVAAVNAVANYLFTADVIGFASLDLVVFEAVDKGRSGFRMWADRLSLGPSTTLAAYELFHFVCKGRQDVNEQGALSYRLDETVATPRERCYAVVPFLYERSLASVRTSAFFSLCRLNNVTLDMSGRRGTLFVLLDSLASGTLGALCIGASSQSAVQYLCQALSVVALQSQKLGPGGLGRTPLLSLPPLGQHDSQGADEPSLSDLHATFRRLHGELASHADRAGSAARRV